jgi:lysophospholipase L1-like esterase
MQEHLQYGPSMRRFLVPLILIVSGTVAACVALEIVLQAAAVAVRITHPSETRAWVQGWRRVLCLEKLWNASGKQPPIDVLNAGYPGMNSSRLRQNFRPMLEEIRPDVTIVMIGANDYWTLRVPVDGARSWITVVWDLVRQHSRLYRAVFLTVRSVDRRQFEMPAQREISANPERTVRYGDAEFSFGYERARRQRDHDEQLVANLTAIAEEARRFNTHLILLTHPSRESNYGDGGRLTRIAAEVAAVPLVDMQDIFAQLCPKEPCLELFFKDHHPTAQGYRLMAEALVKQNLEGQPPTSMMGPPLRRWRGY